MRLFVANYSAITCLPAKMLKYSKVRTNIHLLVRKFIGRLLFEIGTCIMDYTIDDTIIVTVNSLIGIIEGL